MGLLFPALPANAPFLEPDFLRVSAEEGKARSLRIILTMPFSCLTNVRVACSALGLVLKWKLRGSCHGWDRERHKWVIPIMHRCGMPRLCSEVSVSFLEEGITELSPGGLEAIPHRAR